MSTLLLPHTCTKVSEFLPFSERSVTVPAAQLAKLSKSEQAMAKEVYQMDHQGPQKMHLSIMQALREEAAHGRLNASDLKLLSQFE